MGLRDNVQRAIAGGKSPEEIWDYLVRNNRLVKGALAEGQSDYAIKERLGLVKYAVPFDKPLVQGVQPSQTSTLQPQPTTFSQLKPTAFEKAKAQAKTFLPQLAGPATQGMPAAKTALSGLYAQPWKDQYEPMQMPQGGIQPIPQPDPRSQALAELLTLQEVTQGGPKHQGAFATWRDLAQEMPFINDVFNQEFIIPGMTKEERAGVIARQIAKNTPTHMMMAPGAAMYRISNVLTEPPVSALFGAKDFDELFAKTSLGKIKIPIPGKAIGLDKDFDIPLSIVPAFGARMLASAAFWGAFSKALGEDPAKYVTGDKEAAKVSDLKNAIDNQDWQRVGEFLKKDLGFVQNNIEGSLSGIMREIKASDPEYYQSLKESLIDVTRGVDVSKIPTEHQSVFQKLKDYFSSTKPTGPITNWPGSPESELQAYLQQGKLLPSPSYPLGFSLPPGEMPPMDAEILSERLRPQLNPPSRDYPLSLSGGAFSGGPFGGGIPDKIKTLPSPSPKTLDELFKEAQEKFYKEQAGKYWTEEPKDTITETKPKSGKPEFDIDKMNDPEYFESLFKTQAQRIEEQKKTMLAKEQQAIAEVQAEKQQKVVDENTRIEKELGLKHGDIVTRTIEGIGAIGDEGKIVYDSKGRLSVRVPKPGMPNKTMLLPVTYEWGKKIGDLPAEHKEQLTPISTMHPDMKQVLLKSGMSKEEIEAESYPDVLRTVSGNDPKTGDSVSVKLYHGSGRQNIKSVYSPGATGAVLGKGKYWAISSKDASLFGPKVKEQIVTLNNPFVISNDKQLSTMMGQQIPLDNASRVPLLEKVRKKIEEMGHDGVLINIPQHSDVDIIGNSVKRLREIFDTTQVIQFENMSKQKGEINPGGLLDLQPKQQTKLPKIITEETGAISLPALKQTVQNIRDYLKPEERNDITYKVDNLLNQRRALEYGMNVRYKDNVKAVPDETERKLQGLEMLQGGRLVTPLQQQARQLFDAWGQRAEASGRISGRIPDYVPYMTTADYKTWKEVNKILGNNPQALQRFHSVDPRFSTWLGGRQIHRESIDFADYQSRLDNINQELARLGSNIRLKPETDLAKLIYNYEHQVERQVVMQEFMNDMEQYHHPVSGKPMFVKATQKMADPDYVLLPEGINIKTGIMKIWNPKINAYDRIEYKYYLHKDLASAFRNFLLPDVRPGDPDKLLTIEKGYKGLLKATNFVKRVKMLNPIPLGYQKMLIRTIANQGFQREDNPLWNLIRYGDLWRTGREAMKDNKLIEDFIASGGQWTEEFEETGLAPSQQQQTIIHEGLSKVGLIREEYNRIIGDILKINRLQEYIYRYRDYRRKGLSPDDARSSAAHDANEMTYGALRHRQSPDKRAFLNTFFFSKNAIDNQLSRFKRLAGYGPTKGLFTSEQAKAMSQKEWEKLFGLFLITMAIPAIWNKKTTGRWFNTEDDTIGKIAYYKDDKTGEVSYIGMADWLNDFLWIATGQPKKFYSKLNPIGVDLTELGTGRELWSGRDISKYPPTSVKGLMDRAKHIALSISPDERTLYGAYPIKRIEGQETIRKISKETELRRMEENKKVEDAFEDGDITGAARILFSQGLTSDEVDKRLSNEVKGSLLRGFSRMNLEDKYKALKELQADQKTWNNIPINLKIEMSNQLEKAEKNKRKRAR